MEKKYFLSKNPIIDKYLVFLCGAYFRDKPFDKRKILIDFINHISGKRISPIVVDEFLNNDDIETASFTIEQYEELIANVSFANFIYLESFSSASELGLFTHSSSTNKNIVFYPDSSNLILDKIGYFIKVGVLTDSKRIESVPYLALVDRFAHGSDFIDEHYYFAKNELPDNIKAKTSETIKKILNQKVYLKINNVLNTPDSLDFFELAIDSERKYVYISSKTAFYILYALLFNIEHYDDVILLDITNSFEYYSKTLKETILNTIYYYNYGNDASLIIKVQNFKTLNDFVSCALFFIKYMSKRSVLSKNINKSLLLRPNCVLTHLVYKDKENFLITVPRELFSIKKTKCIKRFTLYKKHRARNIISYDDLNGEPLKYIHKEINKDLHRVCNEFGLYSNCSFAYKKGINTLDCVTKHSNSSCFLKMDIHQFFETMSFDLLKKKIYGFFENSRGILLMSPDEKVKFARRLHSYLDVLTINKKFPIGFITSPIISEIYLSTFDRRISEMCKKSEIVYTRYADDLMFSSQKQFNFELIENAVKAELKSLELSINDKKTQKKNLVKSGDSIHYIGFNFVFDGSKTFISIGKSFIKKLAALKVYGPNSTYTIKKIEGLEAYLKYNDTEGFKKYQNLLNIYIYKKKH